MNLLKKITLKKILCRTRFFTFFTLICGTALFPTSLFAQSNQKFTGWRKAETEHFNFIFEESSRQTTQAYAQIADEAWNKISKIYGFPQEKTNVYITDRTNTVNAYTFFSPLEIMMFTSPVITPEFTFREDWKKLFFTHELIHVANMDFEDKADGFWPIKVFGPAFRTFDSQTGWALEGLTTVLETELTNGGRGRSPYFELMYKAPTLDNGFISYDDVGLDAEPPYSQSYVIGYLMMRSIADRWGINTLADIERNRSFWGDWDEAVEFVTGQSAEDIYRDVRISLAKKYKNERDIPEGLIISPRATGTFYYKPAIVLDDGTLITLRGADGQYAAAVKLDPSAITGSNYIHKTKPKEDLNTVFKETILFSGSFSDELALTADQNGNLYASMAIERYDTAPGMQVEFSLYSWNEEEGLKKLTNNTSLFQPSVSRDGKTLVAVEQNGLKMRLVKVDTKDGTVTPLLQSPDYDLIQPAVNDDGTKVAFLCVGDFSQGYCAEVSVLDLTRNLSPDQPQINFKGIDDSGIIVARNYAVPISDPSYPSWNSDGKLLFTDNKRGRLEVFESTVEFATRHDFNIEEEDSDEICTKPVPVVSDPIGALWAYQNERGIYYWSYASNGYVIKMKPNSEWKVVPETNGPSMPGQIIHLGDLQRDYPDFKPYEVPSEEQIAIDRIKQKEEEKQEKSLEKNKEKTKGEKAHSSDENANLSEADDNKKTTDTDDAAEEDEDEAPTPVEPKEVARRPYELTKKSNGELKIQTTLQNERKYFPTIQPYMYMPIVWLEDFGFSDEIDFGFGGFFIGLTPKLQITQGTLFADGLYYPSINNFEATVGGVIPIGTVDFDFALNHFINGKDFLGEHFFVESNIAVAGCTIPLYHRFQHINETNLSIISSLNFNAERKDTKIFSITQSAPTTFSLFGQAGVEFLQSRKTKDDGLITFDATALALGIYDFNLNRAFIGTEAELEFETGCFSVLNYSFRLCGRYTDFPSAFIVTNSHANYTDDDSDCTYPGRLLAKFAITTWYGNIFAETGVAFGNNTVDYTTPSNGNFLNFTYDKSMALGYEFQLGSGFSKFSLGYKYRFYFENPDKNKGEFFTGITYNWLRN